MKKVLCAAFLLLQSGGLAHAGGYDAIHTVAVVSAMGDEVTMRTVGETVFTNDAYMLRLDGTLDADIARQAAALLSPRFEVRAVSVDASAIINRKFEIFSGDWQGVSDWVTSLPKTNGVDAYVIVAPLPAPNYGIDHKGAQVMHMNRTFGGPVIDMTVYYAVGVFDARTGDRIDSGYARYADPDVMSGYSLPFARCAGTIWADSAAAATPEQKAQILRETESLAGRSLGYTMSEAKLIDDARAAQAEKAAPQGDPSCHAVF